MNKDDVRIQELIKPGEEGDIVIVGFPYDEGVRRNGGRVGAASGPEKVGTLINPELKIDTSKLTIVDSGDIDGNLELEDAHDLLEKRISKLISNGSIPFVIGGGNDQSYPNALGLLKNKKEIGVINIDAHFDVRPKKEGKVHSGSPFRMLLENSKFKGKNFVEFATQGVQCSDEHAKYLESQGSQIHWLSEIQKNGVLTSFKNVLDSLPDDIFVSFDIDSIDSAFCPGVSCPATIGLTAQDALDICFEAGRNPKVKLVDISEYNPKIEEYRTGRLIGHMFAYFIYGFSQRK